MPAPIYKVACACCGTIQDVTLPEHVEQENWLPCLLPTGFEWNLPAGKITPIVGEPIYKDATGNDFSRKDYIAKYSIDPEIAYTMMRAGVHKPVLPLGSVNNQEPKPTAYQRKVMKLGKGR